MKSIQIFFFLTISLVFYKGNAQDIIKLDMVTDGETIKTCNAMFYDEGGPNGNYNNSTGGTVDDWTVTICPDGPAGSGIILLFNDFALGTGDTMIIYEGPDITYPRLVYNNSDYMVGTPGGIIGYTVAASQDNVSGCFTFRFIKDHLLSGRGWDIDISCRLPCQKIDVAFKDTFYIARGSQLIPKEFKKESGSTGDVLYADICAGDSIKMEVSLNFPESVPGSGYVQTPATTKTIWDYGDRVNIKDSYGDTVFEHKYSSNRGYLVSLYAEDQEKCRAGVNARVRIAYNPVKEVTPLQDICARREVILKAGYYDDIVLIPVEGTSSEKQKYEKLTFIPDLPTSGIVCYDQTVEFTDFGNAIVEKAGDVCAICLLMEHSFMGDLRISLKCPTGQKVALKNDIWGATGPGGGASAEHDWKMGIPYGGPDYQSPPYDNINYHDNPDSNKAGIPWRYCWSDNESYMQLNPRGVAYKENPVIQNVRLEEVYTEWGYMGKNTVVDSSNYSKKSGFFQPAESFAGLIGCQLNGFWTIEICDETKLDNGWIAEWSMDLCDARFDPWEYKVEVDTTLWEGEGIESYQKMSGRIFQETPGHKEYYIDIIDEYGCIWDIQTGQDIVETPKVNLLQDTLLCPNEMVSFKLDAGSDSDPNYTYIWEPTGEVGPIIYTDKNLTQTTSYIVEASHRGNNVTCVEVDTFTIVVGIQPNPMITADRFPLEGCEPFKVSFVDNSEGATSYSWDFGDGFTSNENNPTHEYKSGKYKLVYAASSDDNCWDSIMVDVDIFSSPKAEFAWDPVYPTLKDPSIQLINKTDPQNDGNIYLWKIQTNPRNPNSIKYIQDSTDLLFSWSSTGEELAHGVYTVELRTSTKNIATSGNQYECADSISYEIRILNDFLQFPNVVTPNGDGANDVFQIKSLVDGMGYPQNELYITDRAGKRVFYKKNIQVESDFWDPKATNTPPGTYFYRFIGKGSVRDVEYRGTVEVLIK